MSLVITFDDSDLALLKGFADALPRVVPIWLEQGSEITEDALRANVPVKSGKLQSSIERIVGETEATIGPTASYAAAVNDGTAPHVIVPKNARALMFVVGGRTVFAKRVNHPGTAGKHFMENTVAEVRGDLLNLFRDLVLEAIPE